MVRAAERSQLEFRGRRELGEAVLPLQTNALCQFRVLLHVFFDQRARGRACLAREVYRQQIHNDFPRDVHVSFSYAFRRPASASRARCTFTLTAASESPNARAISS